MNTNSNTRDTLQEDSLLLWYRIKHVLGKGGFGITYLATDVNLDRQVAIKEYLPSEMASRDGDSHVIAEPAYINEYQAGLNRFIREARTIAKFDHPNVVKVLNVFEENNTAYMVMAYERGKDLRELLRSTKTLVEDQIIDIIIPVLEGLELVHNAGFIHRDIKPGNIMIREDGSPVLIDFGSAYDTKKSSEQITALVSPGFTPHEQYTGDADTQGPWTDIYSLGATLYRCICGRNPVDALTRGSALLKQKDDPLIPASDIGAGKYSANLLAAIDHSMSFNEEHRPKNISSWKRELLGTTTSQHFRSEIKQNSNSRRNTNNLNDTQEIEMTHDLNTLPPVKVKNNAMRYGIAAGIAALTIVIGFILVPGDSENDLQSVQTTSPAKENILLTSATEKIESSTEEVSKDDLITTRLKPEPGTVFNDSLRVGIPGPSMIVVPTGEFVIGSNINETGRNKNEGPRKQVRITQPVALSQTEITVGQFRNFVRSTGYITRAEKEPDVGCRVFNNGWGWEAGRNWKDPGYQQDDKHPVVCVSWDDAFAYIEWLSTETGEVYSLPSEAEWEYAARSGSNKSRFWEEQNGNTCDYANVSDITHATAESLNQSPDNIFMCEDGYTHSSPVAAFNKNVFGFYDMLGNVWEWTADCWNNSYDALPSDGQPHLGGNCGNRVYRGGSWGNYPALIRAAKRGTDPREFRYYNVGFRVSRLIQPESSSTLVSLKTNTST